MPKFKNSNATFWVIFKQCEMILDLHAVYKSRKLWTWYTSSRQKVRTSWHWGSRFTWHWTIHASRMMSLSKTFTKDQKIKIYFEMHWQFDHWILHWLLSTESAPNADLVSSAFKSLMVSARLIQRLISWLNIVFRSPLGSFCSRGIKSPKADWYLSKAMPSWPSWSYSSADWPISMQFSN